MSDAVVYVSLPPNTFPDGQLALIRNLRSRASATAYMADGGFDPVPIGALSGDSIEIDIASPRTPHADQVILSVPTVKPPVVVRTEPPQKRPDVPLNANLVVVFSEPVDPKTVTTASIKLWLGTTTVAGTVTMTDSTHIVAEFVPAAPLAPNALYVLSVSESVRDLDGESVGQSVAAAFTTAPSLTQTARITVTPAAVTMKPGETIQVFAQAYDSLGNQIPRPVSWSSQDTTVAEISGLGVVNAISLGTTSVTAVLDSVTATVIVHVVANPPRILVDASRDGGVWWFPQGGVSNPCCNPGSDHQGRALADSLRAMGYVVDELPRPSTITLSQLQHYPIVIRASAFQGQYGVPQYTQQEIAAYQAYVQGGGNLLLLADHYAFSGADPQDTLGLSFGLPFAGIVVSDSLLTFTSGNPVTTGMGPIVYTAGSGLLSVPAGAQVLGVLPSSFLDLNDNGQQDANEPSDPPVFGVMSYGSGRIVFCGDTNLWELIPQPLLSNVLSWFASP